jgi:hypothetical protein
LLAKEFQTFSLPLGGEGIWKGVSASTWEFYSKAKWASLAFSLYRNRMTESLMGCVRQKRKIKRLVILLTIKNYNS